MNSEEGTSWKGGQDQPDVDREHVKGGGWIINNKR